MTTTRSAVLVTLLLLAACAARPTAAPQPAAGPAVQVLTFNIRYGTASDGENAWPNRERLVYDVIRHQDSDFVGLQEALRFQIDGIRAANPGYDEVGAGRSDGGESGEYSAILYKTARWRPADSGTFWLSDTPAIPGSASWGNEITRIVTWGRFINRETGQGIWIFNTHFDHVSQRSREKSAELLARRIAEREPKGPVVVTGDFNAGERNPAILYLKNMSGRAPVTLVDTFRVLHPDAGAVGTFGAFEGRRDGPKIDYVFAEPGTRVRRAGIVADAWNGRYPSDHFPVYAEFELPAH